MDVSNVEREIRLYYRGVQIALEGADKNNVTVQIGSNKENLYNEFKKK